MQITVQTRAEAHAAQWERIQKDARAGKWGEFNFLRTLLVERASRENPDEGIGTSDINHMIFGLVSYREDATEAEVMGELIREVIG